MCRYVPSRIGYTLLRHALGSAAWHSCVRQSKFAQAGRHSRRCGRSGAGKTAYVTAALLYLGVFWGMHQHDAWSCMDLRAGNASTAVFPTVALEFG